MKSAPAMHSSAARHGSVLIVVLWASIGLVSIALLFGHSMALNYRGSDNDLAGRQADQAIEGAIHYAESLLVNQDVPGTFPDPTAYVAEALLVGEASFWLLGRPDVAGSGTTREFGLVDEASKLNLNVPWVTSDILQRLPGMTPDLADAIVEWRNPTDDGKGGSGGITATVVKHGPFESIEELALVGGATRAILYGEDTNMNGVLDANEDDGDRSLPADNSDGKLDPGILEYVTAFSKEPTKTSEDSERVNIATREGIQEFLRRLPEWLPDRAAAIAQLLGPQPQPSVLELIRRAGLTAEEAATITKEIRGPFVEGLININTASETVLACVLGDDKAQALISARESRTDETNDMTWALESLGEDGVRAAGMFLTGSSYQLSADVAAVGRHGRGYRRTRVVIDVSTGTPRVIYRRNLAPLGWALGRDIRQQLALKKDLR